MSKRIAICIGINSYLNLPQADLQFAHNDAEDITKLLRDPLRGGFDSVTEIYDDKATKEFIFQEIDRVFSDPNLTSEDLVLFYFSGHGALDGGDDLYLVPHDISFLSDGSVRISSAIHIKSLEILLGNSKSGYVIVLLDACHSGGAGKLLGRVKYRDEANIILVGAARYSEKAWESPELEHGRFTECLLRAANERPTYGEWITLQQILAHAQIEMQKLGDGQMIEISSHFVNPNIGVFRNPLYSLESQEFIEEIKELFKLAGDEILSTQPAQTVPNLFIVQERLGFGRQSQTAVMCLNNSVINVIETHINQFKTIFQSIRQDGQTTNGMIVTATELPSSLKKLLAPFLTLEIKTKDELQRNLISFNRYLEYLVDDFEKGNPELSYEPNLKDCYIELNTNLKRADQVIPITEAINEWLAVDNSPAAIVIGGYGTGKTTFSRKLSRDLAQVYLKNSDKRNLRIPILLYLREFPRAHVDIEAFIIAHLKRRCRVTNPDFEAFQAMHNAGLFLLIFDGFDEMVVRADEDTIRRNLAAMERFAGNLNAKILLTSRPEFFRSIEEERELFSSQDSLTRKRPRYKRIALLPLTQEQVELYLKKRIQLNDPAKDWTYYRDRINLIPGFQDLTRRPVLLEMIVKTLPKLIESNSEINRATLYNTYLRGEIARQQETKQRQLLINQEERFRLMRVIARHFYTENPPGLTAEQVQNLLKDELSRQYREELEAHVRDFLAASFLIRENDQYRFSHRSIMEYLAAKDLAEEIETQTPKVFKTYKLTPEVRDFLIDLKPEPDIGWRKTLWGWIQDTAGKTKEDAGYLGGNAATMLNFMKESFEKKDFRYATLTGANLRRAICANACFQSCNLEDTDLSECDMSSADLTNAVFGEFGSGVCPSCGTPVPKGAAFCDNCGASLPNSSITVKVKGAIICETKGLDTKPKQSGYFPEANVREWMLKQGAVEESKLANRDYIHESTNQSLLTPEIICPTCSTKNVHDAITCSTCGTSFTSKPQSVDYVCSECRAKITPGHRYCGACGTPLSAIQCRSCYTLNSRNTDKCYRCHTEFTVPQGLDTVETPSKLAKPSLLCTACGAVNSSDAYVCLSCNHELGKPFVITCPRCGSASRAGSIFCDNCGASLTYPAPLPLIPPPPPPPTSSRPTQPVGTSSCPSCGQTVIPGEMFCDNCGAALTGTPLPPPSIYVPPSLVGTLLANQYRLLRVHGEGGISRVYLAEDTKAASRLCVIKEALHTGNEGFALLRWQAELLATLNHSGLPKIYNTVSEGGKWYSVIELIEGPTLLERLETSPSPLSETAVVNWAIQICDILDYLHNQEPPIIVRDIKPANFIVRKDDNRIVLIDLSISRCYKPEQARDTTALGTPGYAPPEQYGHAQTDARADIYGLGATIHQLLSQYDPSSYPFNFPDILGLNANLNPKWKEIISKATQLKPSDRYQSAVEMKADLIQLAGLVSDNAVSGSNFVGRFQHFIKKLIDKW